jgi:polyisoprenoid-binding protein YceI
MSVQSRFPLPALAATCMALSFALTASADFKSIDTPEVGFLVGGPAGLKITGTSSDLSAAETGGKLTVVTPLKNLKTGIGLRDEHLKKYLEVETYPNAKLVIDRSKLKLPDDNQSGDGDATGDFTLHGVTKPLAFKYHAKRTGSDYHIQGLATIDITQFGIKQPCYLGVCTDTEVKLKVKFKLRDQ